MLLLHPAPMTCFNIGAEGPLLVTLGTCGSARTRTGCPKTSLCLLDAHLLLCLLAFPTPSPLIISWPVTMIQPSLSVLPSKKVFRAISFLNCWVLKHLALWSSCPHKTKEQHRPESMRGLCPRQLYPLPKGHPLPTQC